MLYRFSLDKIKQMLINQIKNIFFVEDFEEKLISKYLIFVLDRVEKNFLQNPNKYYSSLDEDGEKQVYFDPLHTCQWLIFLYYFANTIFMSEKTKEARILCDKLYGLSKMMSGADVYYEVELPETFRCDHPVGAVIGRGQFGKNFSFLQGCTIGNNKGVYPIIGDNVTMYSNSKIIGDCKIGNNVIVSANTYIKDQDVPDNVIVYGSSPNLIFKNYDE